MGMYHSSSGKEGFGAYVGSPVSYFTKEIIRKILIREDELRASDFWQSEYSKEDRLQWFEEVTHRIQIEALEDNGVAAEELLTRGIDALRRARFRYKDDPNMNQLTVYMRNDRSREGSLLQGDDAPNVPLHTIEGTPIMLHEYIKNLNSNKPLFVMAGSIS